MSQINQEKIKQLKSEAEKIIELSNKFFSSITIQTENQMVSKGSRIPQFEGGYRITKPIYVKNYSWGKRSTEISEMQVELLRKYDFWYEESRFIIKTFLSERLEAFNESYKKGRKYINLDYTPNPLGITYFFNDFRKWFNIGQNILLLVSSMDKTEFDAIEKKEKSNSKNLYFDNVETVIYSERDTHAGDITINPSPPRAPVKKKSLVDILGNSASIASFIIALVGILLQFFINFQYAVILIIIGIVIFVLFALKSKED